MISAMYSCDDYFKKKLGEPRKVAALMYTYVDGMLDKRGPFRSGHLDLLKTMSEEGDCLLGEFTIIGTPSHFCR